MAEPKKKASEEKTTVGITVKKNEDFPEWYQQVVTKADLADYTSVSGCMVLKPYGYSIWEKIVAAVDSRLKKMGVKNCYFPLFIPESLLKKEQEHVEGFAPEVAWVTHAGNTKLDERLAVRPTSETIMYESYSKWIRSWRDLPMKLNQWNNVVRWEFKHPTPFIRTREFLWNEGHTAFATREEAEQEIIEILALWKEITEDYLALAGITGRKSEAEKFAGAIASYSLEYCLPNGRAAQGPDAHFDGQNFAKAFNISFLNQKGESDFVWQNTWAITTRMIGVMVMTHGDDYGLVLPPKIAPTQAIIVPIIFEDSKKEVIAAAEKIRKELEHAGITVDVDSRETYTAGWKFNESERIGIPIRIELGPRDLAKKEAVLFRRDTRTKITVKAEDVVAEAKKTLDDIQQSLFKKSQKLLHESVVEAKSIDEINAAVKDKKLVRAFYCGSKACEEEIKAKCEGTSSRNLTIDAKDKGKCIVCGKEGVPAHFGRGY
jgi:prolyl-tRNA synthetase